MNIEKLLKWAQEVGTRRKIEIECCGQIDESPQPKIWVFDYDLMIGTHIECVDEIDSLDMKKVAFEALQKQKEEMQRLLDK